MRLTRSILAATRPFVLALLTIATGLPAAMAATWHVNNTTGNDALDGKTPTAAFATIRKAISCCATSDRLVLAKTGKAYLESIELNGLGGTPARPFVIEGNGAVLCGFKPVDPAAWQKREDGLWFFPYPRPAMRPYLRFDGQRVEPQRKPDALQPGQYCWTETGVLFRPEAGKTPAGSTIDGTFLVSGLAIAGASYIRCQDLVAEGFSNDGFNIHGDCQAIECRNIESRHNGDDGFSIHEDVSSVVYHGWFHHNDYGIQDVHSGRSSYFGILSEDNRVSGVEFHGGLHQLVDAVVRRNAGAQMKVNHSPAAHIGLAPSNLTALGLSVLKNVLAIGGKVGLEVEGKGSVMASNCVFRDAETGVLVGPEATCHLTASVVDGCRDLELSSLSPRVELDLNVYHPGRFSWQTQRFEPTRWDAFRQATGQDKQSRLLQPSFSSDGILQLPLSDPSPKAPQFRPGLTSPAFTRPTAVP
ncbi:MAG: hypothetical protein ACOYMV_07945 [Verrucomicrobiia bacterium]